MLLTSLPRAFFLSPRFVGAGYQYRLCPANEELNEDCFQRNPLDFDPSKQALEWKNGTRMLVPSPQYVDEGIIPVGSTWCVRWKSSLAPRFMMHARHAARYSPPLPLCLWPSLALGVLVGWQGAT